MRNAIIAAAVFGCGLYFLLDNFARAAGAW